MAKIPKEVFRYIVGLYLDKVFGEHLKTTVKEQNGYYYIGIRVSYDLANKVFKKASGFIENIKRRGIDL